jgi:hypothetical protein
MDKAAAAFKKQQQAREGEKAMAEYRAAQLAEEAKTERLRALRLAREGMAQGANQTEAASETPTPAAESAKPVAQESKRKSIAPARKPAARRSAPRKRR